MASARPEAVSKAREPKLRRPFDIDNYLNPFVPRSPLYLLPVWLSFFLGYRAPASSPPAPRHHHPLHTLNVWVSVFVGAFCGLAIIENVFLNLPRLGGHEVPIVIASFGAAAILEYNTIESPLSQPRNLVLGHFFSAVVAVGITKLFLLLPPDRFEELRWLAGALAVGTASVVMSITKTVHPPAGATALLAATNVEIQLMGWWLLPLSLLAGSLMLASACILNNAANRRFPLYWWTPVDVGKLRDERRRATREPEDVDIEKTVTNPAVVEAEGYLSEADTEAGSQLRKASSNALTGGSSVGESSGVAPFAARGQSETIPEHITITAEKILVPEWMEVNDWERDVLRILRERLRDGLTSE